MRIEEGMLIGKVTEVATGRSSAELRFDLARYGWNRTTGLAGVNGGSAGSWGGTSYATASFDDVTVYRALASNLAAPTGLAVTEVGSNQVTLTWADNSDNEDGFRIERSTDGVTFTRVAATGPDATRFVATGLNSRTTYYFRVRAYNAGGDSAPTSSAEVTTPEIAYEAVFRDDFEDNAINAADWSLVNGTWSEAGGVLRQSGTAFADEKKALVRSSEGATRVTALVRVDAWVDGEYARAGVTLLGRYNLVFTGRIPGQERVEFVHDGVAWSGWPSQAGEAGYAAFDWTPGQWYLFDMRIEEGMLIGKVTEVATGRSSAELRFDLARYGWNRTTGLAGVNGGSAGSWGGTSYATASFDDVTVYRAPGRHLVRRPGRGLRPDAAHRLSDGEHGRAAVRRVPPDAGRARIRIRILGRCRAGQDQGPTLPAPPARLIRVGLPVLEGVPCGGGCPEMAQPPPLRARRQPVRDGSPPGGKRDQHLDIRGRRLYTLWTNAAAVLAVSNRSDRHQHRSGRLKAVPHCLPPPPRALFPLPCQIETRPNDFVSPRRRGPTSSRMRTDLPDIPESGDSQTCRNRTTPMIVVEFGMAARRPPRGRGAGPRPRPSKASNRGPCSRPSRVGARSAPRCAAGGRSTSPARSWSSTSPGPARRSGPRCAASPRPS